MGLHEFVTLLKAEKPRNDKRINQLAQKVDIGDTYNEADVLTLAIYYEHRDSFDILIKRKADLNPMFYQNIPPHLWSLEVFNSDEYFFRQLVANPKLNLFQKSENFAENILFNMCSKLHDSSLFKEVFQQLVNKDSEQLSELFGVDVFQIMNQYTHYTDAYSALTITMIIVTSIRPNWKRTVWRNSPSF